MTISSTTLRKTATGDGSTTAVTFPYRFLADADLKVYLNGTLKTLSTHYTLTGAGAAGGGTVTFLTAPAVDAEIVILNDPSNTQALDLVDNDSFPAESMERTLDRLTLQIQRCRDLIARSVVLADTDTTSVSATLPAPGAGHYLRWNNAGTALEAVSVVADSGSFLGSGTGAVSRSVSSKLGDVVSVKDYGAKGDGATDDTAALQAAINSGVGGLFFPTGNYVTGKLTISSRIAFVGALGAAAGVTTRPRLFLKNGTNDHLIRVTTTGELSAHNMDFYGNKAGQTGTSWGLYLDNDSSGVYAASNAVRIHNSFVRYCKSGGIYGGTNRNTGMVTGGKCLLDSNDGDGAFIEGLDWVFTDMESGNNTGHGLRFVDGASNDVTGCDLYYNGESGIKVGAGMRMLNISGGQINSNAKHGIDLGLLDDSAVRGIRISGVIFAGNSTAATGTYSDIYTNTRHVTISDNAHWPATTTKPKYLVETPVTFAGTLTVLGAVYDPTSYVTDYTRDRLAVAFIDSRRLGIAAGLAMTVYGMAGSGGTTWLQSYVGSSANDTFRINRAGTLSWGDGTNPVDTALTRGAADMLTLGSADMLRLGQVLKATLPSAATYANCLQIVTDPAASKGRLVYSDGAAWRYVSDDSAV